jgi:hypothetical protein
MDSSIYALEQFISNGGKQLQWADWFIIQILLETEYKAYVTYAITQLPKKFDKTNPVLLEAVETAKDLAKDTMDNQKPSSAKRTVEWVVRANMLHTPEINTDNILTNIIKYGIQLLKNRKL